MTLLYFLAFSVILNLVLYVVAYLFQTDKITDISYSFTFIIIVITGFYFSGQDLVDLIFTILILVWALRLGSYLFYRILKMGYDDRFDEIRNNPLSFLGFWIMQGLTCAIVSFSFLLSMDSDLKSIKPLFLIGAALAFLGLLIETIADYQKFKFKTKHPGSFMNRGLWKKIRHPNYTGELLFWWGIFLASIPFAKIAITILSPIWISLIIIRFSGIPVLEKKWDINFKEDKNFRAYQKNSWRLIPYLY